MLWTRPSSVTRHAVEDGTFVDHRLTATQRGASPPHAPRWVAVKRANANRVRYNVFPEEVDVSGTNRLGHPKQGTETHMSRKGNDLVRRLLYTAAQCAVTWNPPVKALFARVRPRVRNPPAVGGCSRCRRKTKGRGPQASGRAAWESGHRDRSQHTTLPQRTTNCRRWISPNLVETLGLAPHYCRKNRRTGTVDSHPDG
jgi:hypothetical protein